MFGKTINFGCFKLKSKAKGAQRCMIQKPFPVHFNVNCTSTVKLQQLCVIATSMTQTSEQFLKKIAFIMRM